MTALTQMALFYDATVPISPKTCSRDRRQAERIIAEMRRLHDELNAALPYAGAEKPQINSPARMLSLWCVLSWNHSTTKNYGCCS